MQSHAKRCSHIIGGGEGQIQLTLPHNGDGSDLQVEVVKLNYFL